MHTHTHTNARKKGEFAEKGSTNVMLFVGNNTCGDRAFVTAFREGRLYLSMCVCV